jgi:ATP-dependent helicase YprA (DUF1998 family)
MLREFFNKLDSIDNLNDFCEFYRSNYSPKTQLASIINKFFDIRERIFIFNTNERFLRLYIERLDAYLSKSNPPNVKDQTGRPSDAGKAPQPIDPPSAASPCWAAQMQPDTTKKEITP